MSPRTDSILPVEHVVNLQKVRFTPGNKNVGFADEFLFIQSCIFSDATGREDYQIWEGDTMSTTGWRYRCPGTANPDKRQHVGWQKQSTHEPERRYYCRACDAFYDALVDMKTGNRVQSTRR